MLRKKINQTTLYKRLETNQETLCGVVPFVLPSWFSLTPCCSQHDRVYLYWRMKAIETVLYRLSSSITYNGTLDEHEFTYQQTDMMYQKVDTILKSYRLQILLADRQFFECMNAKIDTYFWLVRPFYRIVSTKMEIIVRELGWNIWYKNTYSELKALLDIKD